MGTFSKAVVAGALQLPPATPAPAPWVPEPLLNPPCLLGSFTTCLPTILHAAACTTPGQFYTCMLTLYLTNVTFFGKQISSSKQSLFLVCK